MTEQEHYDALIATAKALQEATRYCAEEDGCFGDVDGVCCEVIDDKSQWCAQCLCGEASVALGNLLALLDAEGLQAELAHLRSLLRSGASTLAERAAEEDQSPRREP